MKKIYTLIAFLFSIMTVEAQHETDIWYFGTNAGIDFNSGSPVNLVDGQVSTVEGSSSISTPAGDLLFYTDGIRVWTKNHTTMVNGNNLHGGYSSSQSALIIQQPGSDSLYYIFTIAESGGNDGMQYSVVDMSLQAGLGEVIIKNVPLVPSTTEKVTAAPHSNGTDFWVITHDLSNNDFYAFQLSAAGVNSTPVISSVGSVLLNIIGYMKVSHAGDKIAFGAQYDNFFELFDINNTTGEILNPIHIVCPPTAFGPYGVEFSPNDQLLYGTAYSGPCVLLQWDISSSDEVAINASMMAIDSSASSNIGALQLASDGKIYMARYGTSYLGVINDPDVYGFGCNYVDDGFNLSPKQSTLGLPNALPALLNLNPPSLQSQFSASDTTLCEKFCIDFFDSSLNNPVSWLWMFEGADPVTSSDQNPTNICYDDPGIFDVTLITTDASGNSDTLSLSEYITVYQNPFAPVITQTGNLLTSSAADFYQWQLNTVDIPGATSQSYEITQSGLYTVVVYDEHGCSAQADIKATLVGIEDADIPDFSIYPNPASGNIVLEFPEGLISQGISVSVVNAMGQEIYSFTESEWQENFTGAVMRKEINLSNLSSGIYFLRLNFDDHSIQEKIIISK